MKDSKQSQGTPNKGGKQGKEPTRTDPERKGSRNPEPQKKSGSEAGRQGRKV